MFRFELLYPALLVSLIVPAATAAQQTSGSDADYIAKVMPAAPSTVVNAATIVQIQKDGTSRTVRPGTNGFTCMLMPDSTPACIDTNAMAWMHALMTHTAPPNAAGFVYMLAGDVGTSNTDPYAKGPTSSNHWVKTGPHVMIVGSSAATKGYPATADADPTKPYVMWPGTPYAHLMLPVASSPSQ